MHMGMLFPILMNMWEVTAGISCVTCGKFGWIGWSNTWIFHPILHRMGGLLISILDGMK